jgi:hypothetical protein
MENEGEDPKILQNKKTNKVQKEITEAEKKS